MWVSTDELQGSEAMAHRNIGKRRKRGQAIQSLNGFLYKWEQERLPDYKGNCQDAQRQTRQGLRSAGPDSCLAAIMAAKETPGCALHLGGTGRLWGQSTSMFHQGMLETTLPREFQYHVVTSLEPGTPVSAVPSYNEEGSPVWTEADNLHNYSCFLQILCQAPPC